MLSSRKSDLLAPALLFLCSKRKKATNMESQLQPHPQQQQQQQQPGLLSVIEGEGEHGGHQQQMKSSVLKKVKDKAKKVKDKITKHRHTQQHTDDHAYYQENEEEDDEDDPQQLHAHPVHENTLLLRSTDVTNEPRDSPIMEAEKPSKRDSGESNIKTATPNSTGSAGGEGEPEVSPLSSQLGASTPSEDSSRGKTHGQFTPEQTPNKTHPDPEPYSAAAQAEEKTDQDGRPGTTPQDAIVGKLSAARDAVVSKLGYGGPPHEGGGQSVSEVVLGYVDKVAETLDPVYEKLRPGDEDRALSNMVTDALVGKKEGEGEAVGERIGSRVSRSGDVAERLGPAEEEKRGEDAVAAGKESSGEGVVERVRDAVGSWLGMSGGVQTGAQPAARGSDVRGSDDEKSG